MFLLNSRLGLITAALSRSYMCNILTLIEHPFSRSYGVILPSSLTRVLSRALGLSPHLPVSVFGTGTLTWLEAFLGSLDSVTSVLRFPPHHTSGLSSGGFAYLTPYVLGRTLPSVRFTYPPASPLHSNGNQVALDSQPVVHPLRLLASG